MINVSKYIPLTDTWLKTKKYTLYGNFYYVDTNIWFQGELQPPRIIKFSSVDVTGYKAVFIDEDSNLYEVDLDDVFDNERDLESRMKTENRIYENRRKSDDKS